MLRRGMEGKLRSFISDGMDGRKNCPCWRAVTTQFLGELILFEAWPLDDVFPRWSVMEILGRLQNFQFHFSPCCNRCRNMDWVTIVKQAVQDTIADFQGLCIDCMDRSKNKKEEPGASYWAANRNALGQWDSQCRVKHKYSTWMFSWCGRADHKEKLRKQYLDSQ